MAIKLETKLLWFDQGAAALAQAWPGLAQSFQAPVYVCPQCFNETAGGKNRVFFREAVEAKELTAEHVPTESLGGKELILTCASCNHTSGSRIESHTGKREHLPDMMGGHGESKVLFQAGGHSVSATLRADGRRLEMKLPPPEMHANDPRAVDRLQDFLRSEVSQEQEQTTITYVGLSHKPHPARVGSLRAGYLAIFAVLGYDYIFSPGLGIVRRQLQEPEVEHIPAFKAVIPDTPRTERRIMRIHEPEWQRSWAVQIGRNVAFLPLSGDTTLYQRLAEADRNSGGQVEITGKEWTKWPTRPSFCLPAEASTAFRPRCQI